MSSPRRRAAFDPTALDDIDDLLPILSTPEGDHPDPSGAGDPVAPPVQRPAPRGSVPRRRAPRCPPPLAASHPQRCPSPPTSTVPCAP